MAVRYPSYQFDEAIINILNDWWSRIRDKEGILIMDQKPSHEKMVRPENIILIRGILDILMEFGHNGWFTICTYDGRIILKWRDYRVELDVFPFDQNAIYLIDSDNLIRPFYPHNEESVWQIAYALWQSVGIKKVKLV